MYCFYTIIAHLDADQLNFSDFTQEKPYGSLATSAYRSLKEVLESDISNTNICQLVVRELQEIYPSDINDSDRCFNLLWLCSQKLSYPEFYQAWYGTPSSTHPEIAEFSPTGHTSRTQQLDRQFFNLQNQVTPTDTTYPLCLDLSSLQNLNDSATMCQKFATISYQTIDSNFEDLQIPENIQNPAQLETKLLHLRKYLKTKNPNLKNLALILHDSDPTPELLQILNVLQSSFSIAWITDQPHPYRSFLPAAENLLQLIQTWLTELD